MKIKNVPRKPSKILLTLAYILVWPYLKIRYNVKVQNKKILRKIKEPFVVLSNHASTLDPFLIAGAFFPFTINFVGGYIYFKTPILKHFLKLMGAIPKFVYSNDLGSIKQMISVTKNGQNLGLFPAGRLPSCGEGFPIQNSLGKLLKKCDVSIIVAKIDGAYLSKPKWAKTNRRGKITVTINHLLNQEELEKITNDELDKLLSKSLEFNDYLSQEKNLIVFKGRKQAEGIEKILYKCPNCGSEFTTYSKKNLIGCNKCNFNLKFNQNGLFYENNFFKSPFDWFEYQKSEVKKEINLTNINIESPTIIKAVRNGKTKVVGSGLVKLNYNFIIYEGTIDSQKVSIELKTDNLISLPFKAGENFEILINNEVIKFCLENGIEVVKWSILIEEIYKKKHCGN